MRTFDHNAVSVWMLQAWSLFVPNCKGCQVRKNLTLHFVQLKLKVVPIYVSAEGQGVKLSPASWSRFWVRLFCVTLIWAKVSASQKINKITKNNRKCDPQKIIIICLIRNYSRNAVKVGGAGEPTCWVNMMSCPFAYFAREYSSNQYNSYKYMYIW